MTAPPRTDRPTNAVRRPVKAAPRPANAVRRPAEAVRRPERRRAHAGCTTVGPRFAAGVHRRRVRAGRYFLSLSHRSLVAISLSWSMENAGSARVAGSCCAPVLNADTTTR